MLFRVGLGLLMLSLALPPSDAEGGIQTLVSTRPIEAFSQDGTRLAWIEGRGAWPNCGARVIVQPVRSSGRTVLGRLRCHERRPTLTLAGKRAVWSWLNARDSNTTVGAVATANVGTAPRILLRTGWPGDTIFSSGDAEALAFAYTEVYEAGCEPPADPGGNDVCTYSLLDGGAFRIAGASKVRIPSSGRPAAIAVSQGRIAVVPSAAEWQGLWAFEPQAPPNGAMYVRDVRSGSLVTSFSPQGHVEAVALSPTKAAVVARDDNGNRRIAVYDATTGRLVVEVPVDRGTSAELDMAGNTIVYRVRRQIRRIDGTSGAESLVAVARQRPIGLSIEGRRIAWAENAGARGRIRAVWVNY